MRFWTKVIISTVVTLPLVTGACVFGLMTLFKGTKIDLAKLKNPPPQTIVYDQSGKVYMRIGTPPSTLTYQQIPQNLRNAIVATEDHAYWTSSSIDVKSVLRALLVDLRTGRATQGASTIQEQLAKIVYLNDNKTLSYKLKEVAMGVQLSRYFTKQQILAMYLNKVFLGENAIGVREAAMRYFGIDIEHHKSALTLDEAALLAGLPQAPTAYDPLLHPKAALQRRNEVLQNMVKYGYISAATAARAEKAPLGASYHAISQDAWNTHPLFANVLFDYASRHGISPQQLVQGGLKIYTTVDPRVQRAIHTVFWSTNYHGDFPGPTKGTVVEGAAVFVNPKTGGIAGAAGSRKQGYTRLGTDRIYSDSSPGSSIKPIMEYAPAIQSGHWTPLSILHNQSQNFGDGYRPQNWEGPNGPKRVTLQYGLEESQNIASVWLLQQIGLQTGTKFAMNDGIQLTKSDRQHLGVAIGGMQYGVNALEMAQAYEAFDNHGVQVQAHLITKITNQDGQVVYQPHLKTKVVMSTSTATTMTRLMEDVVDYGTGTSAQVPGWGVAGKTGTVQYSAGLTGNNNWVRDAWFDGYTPNLVGSIYLGYDKSSPQHHMTMAPLDPSANAAKIFGAITRLSEQGLAPEHFAKGPFPAAQGTPNAAVALQHPISGLQAMWNPIVNGVYLTWKDKLSSISSFVVSRSTQSANANLNSSASGNNSAKTQITTTNKTSYLNLNVQPGTTYQYFVQALNSNGAPLGQPQSITFSVPGGPGQNSGSQNTTGPAGPAGPAGGGSQNTTGPGSTGGTQGNTAPQNSAGPANPGPNNTVSPPAPAGPKNAAAQSATQQGTGGSTGGSKGG